MKMPYCLTKIFKMRINFKLLLVVKLLMVVLTSFVLIDTAVNCSKQQGLKVKQLDLEKINVNPLKGWNENYELTIEYIKQHEGFAGGKPYICPGGYNTIGYGHLIKETESFTTLSKQQADSLLRSDFNKAIKLVEQYTDLRGAKKLAIAHFVFTRGIGTFLKSPLNELVKNNKKIDDEIVKWCYYRNRNGKRIKSTHALNIRKWELKMYNNRF